MPTFDYGCSACGFTDEYCTHIPAMRPPEMCPECGKEKLVKRFKGSTGFDITGYCYANEYGKKNWKKNLSKADQAKVLAPDENGHYKDPY